MTRPAGDDFTLIIETPHLLGFRGSVKIFLLWLRGLPKRGTLVACLGTGLIAGRGVPLPDGPAGDTPGDLPAVGDH